MDMRVSNISDIKTISMEAKANKLKQKSKNLLYELHGIDRNKYGSKLIDEFVDSLISATIAELIIQMRQ